SWVRSITRVLTTRSILRCCEGERSWSNRITSAETDAAAPAISSSLPLPMSVAGSGRSLRWLNSPAISAPALAASVRSSSSESSDVKSGLKSGSAGREEDGEAATLVAWSRAACAPGVMAADLPAWPARPRVRNSTPTRNARSRCSDGFRTALGSFRELFREIFRKVFRDLSCGLSRRPKLESSRRKQTHFTLRYPKLAPASKPLPETLPQRTLG